MDYSRIRGFNYEPGYAWTLYDSWKYFDADVFMRELSAGKKAFPGFNTVRLWLSWDAFHQEEDRQCANFETALAICDKLGLKAIPLMFNRWHDNKLDAGGIYIDHMSDGISWVARDTDRFKSYIEKFIGGHANDERILAWDMCNEPFSYESYNPYIDTVRVIEKEWLTKIYRLAKAQNPVQPVSLSHFLNTDEALEFIDDISDVFMIHIYSPDITQDEFVRELERIQAFAARHGKEAFTTETCWGSLDIPSRLGMIDRSLGAHKRVGMGFVAHALAYSHVADLHEPEDGPVGNPGNLCFLNKDLTVREGHEIFNNY